MSAAIREPQVRGRTGLPEAPPQVVDPTWQSLYRIAGAAALISVALIPVSIAIYAVSPPPGTVEGWLRLVRAYMVLGDRTKAQAIVTDARQALGKDEGRLQQLNDGLKGLGLEG